MSAFLAADCHPLGSVCRCALPSLGPGTGGGLPTGAPSPPHMRSDEATPRTPASSSPRRLEVCNDSFRHCTTAGNLYMAGDLYIGDLGSEEEAGVDERFACDVADCELSAKQSHLAHRAGRSSQAEALYSSVALGVRHLTQPPTMPATPQADPATQQRMICIHPADTIHVY